jgi:hypothetical protein
MGGKVISKSTQCGPEESQRRSLHIFEIYTIVRFSIADICTNAPESCVPSTIGGGRMNENCMDIPDDIRRLCGDVRVA